MYALLTQLRDSPNYRVISTEIETDKITLTLNRYPRQQHVLTVAKPQKHCTNDIPASFTTFLSVASRLTSLCQTSILL